MVEDDIPSGDRDWAVDQAIAEETAADGSGIPLEAFLIWLEDFGRRSQG